MKASSKKLNRPSQQKRVGKYVSKTNKDSLKHSVRKLNDKQIIVHVVTWTEAENVIKQSRKNPFMSYTQLKQIITSGPFFIYSKNKPTSLYASVSNDKQISARLSGAACHQRIVETKRYTDAKINFSISVDKSLCQKFVTSFVLSNYETNLQTSQDRVKMLKTIELDKYNDTGKLDRFFIIANATNAARKLANTRATEANPGFMEDKIEELLDTYKGDSQIRLQVICGEQDLRKTGLNLIWSVGRGANNSDDTIPRLIVVQYLGNPAKPYQKIAFVGKGITYDTGGLHLKLHHGMDTMYNDKGGACAVFGALKGTLDLDLSVNAIFAFPLAQNAIGPNAVKPSDIVTSYSGKTVQITNTDAEGRLVMADAMSFVQKEYQGVTKLIDIATLTGAIRTAIGWEMAGLFTNSFKFSKRIKKLGQQVDLTVSNIYFSLMFEEYWQMPITAEHRKVVQNQVSDIKNWGEGSAGASTAAAFLQQFVDEGVEWCHMDIAGPAFRKSKKPPLCSHATAFGTQTLINILIQEEGLIDLLH